MSATRSLRLELAPSRVLAIVIAALHVAAASCIAAVLPSLPGALLTLAFLALGAAAAWSRALLRAPGSVRAIELKGDAAVLELASGARVPAEIAPRRHISRYTVTLSILRPRRRTLLLTSGMLDRDSFRLLRIWALWGKLPAMAEKRLPV